MPIMDTVVSALLLSLLALPPPVAAVAASSYISASIFSSLDAAVTVADASSISEVGGKQKCKSSPASSTFRIHRREEKNSASFLADSLSRSTLTTFSHTCSLVFPPSEGVATFISLAPSLLPLVSLPWLDFDNVHANSVRASIALSLPVQYPPFITFVSAITDAVAILFLPAAASPPSSPSLPSSTARRSITFLWRSSEEDK
mmetsp:Transcript_8138/g.21544  ORF Transcript_8138/g.21544 Transcript_8138/m.21544 type:complete len:202 (-) Transcript_8138:388-993(-)